MDEQDDFTEPQRGFTMNEHSTPRIVFEFARRPDIGQIECSIHKETAVSCTRPLIYEYPKR